MSLQLAAPRPTNRREALAAIRAGCLCDYCEQAPAEGWVSAYQSVVCEACYDDNHGTIDG